MKPIGELYNSWVKKLRSIAEQFYSPAELRALAVFICLGVGVLVYRGLTSFGDDARGSHRFKNIKATQDSVFALLARRKLEQDSLFFYAPDTTIEKEPIRPSRSVKAVNLAAGSVSLNRANKLELMGLPSIGSAMADRILNYRAERGKFRTLTELMNVRGIGPKKFERLKDYIRLD